jgi:gliding motility-associated-like protein
MSKIDLESAPYLSMFDSKKNCTALKIKILQLVNLISRCMKNKIVSLLFSLIAGHHCQSQVVCNSTLLKNVTDFCSQNAEFTNAGKPSSTIGPGYCWSDKTTTQEVWYKFNSIGTDVAIIVSVDSIKGKGTAKKPCISLYTGDCTVATPLTEMACSDFGTKSITELYHGGLTPGVVYYIRIATTVANAGTFTLCVNNSTPTANPGADCDGAVKLCNKNQVSVPGLKGAGKNPNEPESNSCMYIDPKLGNSERNSCWYYWVCDQAGTLTFDLKPIIGTNDIDFNLYSIISGTDVCKNRKIERCSATAKIIGDGSTGLNMTETDVQEPVTLTLPDNSPSNAYVKYLDMVSGRTYALLINNANDKSGFTINFGGTGTFVGPVAKATADKVTICPGKSITYDGSKSMNYNALDWNFISGGTPVSASGPGPHVIQYNTPGEYVGILKATDTIGCNSVTSVNITVVQAIPLLVTSDSICGGAMATLKASPDIPGGTYTWNPLPDSGNGSATVTVKPTSQQTYTVTLEKDGCRSIGAGTVYVKSDVHINALTPQTICIGSKAVLTAEVSGGSGTYTYNWLPAGTGNTASVTISPATTQQYTLTVSDGGSCPAAPETVTITVNPPLDVLVTAPDTICAGSSTTLNASANGGDGGPYTFKWTPSNQTTPAVTVSPLISTTYTVTVNDDCGTPVASDSVTITVVQPVPLTVGSDSICYGSPTTLTASPNVPGATYTWNPLPDSGNGTFSVTVKPTAQQTYTVTCRKDGCESTATGTVFIKSTAHLLPLTPFTICIGSSATLSTSAIGGAGNYTYTWLPTGTGTTSIVTVSPITTQQYTVTASDGGACPIPPQTVTVTVRPPLQVLASLPDTICAGNGITVSATAKGGNQDYIYTWQPGGLIGQTVPVKPALTTTYTVTVTDKCGTPSASDIVTIIVIPPPVVKFNAINTSGCAAPLCVSFIDSSTTPSGKIEQWKWNFGKSDSGIAEGASDLQNPKHCYNNSGKYTITLMVINSSGCTSSGSKINMINVYPTPVANFSIPEFTSILTPDVPFFNTTIGGVTWNWDFGDAASGNKNTSTRMHPDHTYSAVGYYCTRLIATNSYNCIDTMIKCLTVEPNSSLYIPNAFTPNGDGRNDTFFAKGENIFDFEMRIFDRWGNLIFYSDDIDKHWDGRVKSDDLIAQQDVYVYDVTAKDIHQRKLHYLGTVTLVK